MPTTVWNSIADKLKTWAGNWSTFILIGTFVLYLLGYLVLRFHLTALGIGTDLSILDERYLFAGASFVVNLVAFLVTDLFIAGTLGAIGYGIYRAVTRGRSQPQSTESPSLPVWLPIAALILGLAVIQFVMRQCFSFANLLFAPRQDIEEMSWIASLFFKEGAGNLVYYFCILLAICVGTTAVLAYSVSRETTAPATRAILGILALVVTVQWLLVPINYGYFVANKTLPRVTPPDASSLPSGTRAWLAWETKDALTYFLVRPSGDPADRSLVTIPRTANARIEIVGYDPILQVLNPKPPETPTARGKP